MPPPPAPFPPSSSSSTRTSPLPTISKPTTTPSSNPGHHSHLTRRGFQPRRRRSAPNPAQPRHTAPEVHIRSFVPARAAQQLGAPPQTYGSLQHPHTPPPPPPPRLPPPPSHHTVSPHSRRPPFAMRPPHAFARPPSSPSPRVRDPRHPGYRRRSKSPPPIQRPPSPPPPLPSPHRGRFLDEEEDLDEGPGEPLDRPTDYKAPPDEGNCWESALAKLKEKRDKIDVIDVDQMLPDVIDVDAEP